APSGPAALLVFDEALHGKVSDDVLKKAVSAGARYIDKPRVDPIVGAIQKRFADNPTQQISLLKALADGLSQRGMPLPLAMRTALMQEIKSVLGGGPGIEWYNTPLAGKQATPSPWGPQQRNYADGDTTTMAISSLVEGGERMGGVLHSPT